MPFLHATIRQIYKGSDIVLKFKNDEAAYSRWHELHVAGFVFKHFGGTNPRYNVMHKSNCMFLWRDKDENSRTAVEKWCAVSELELASHADEVLGVGEWNRCGVCFRQASRGQTETLGDTEFIGDERPATPASGPPVTQPLSPESRGTVWVAGEPAAWIGSGEKEWKAKVSAALSNRPLETAPGWLDFDFRFAEDRLFKKDIDNLITPVLEAVRDSGWVERGFSQLGSITARKSVVPDEGSAGVLIQPRWSSAELSEPSQGVCIACALGSMDADSVKWALYDEAFEMQRQQPEIRFAPGTHIAMDVRVTIDAAAPRKSILALIKPCIDGVEPVLGTPDGRLAVPRTQLDRPLAPQDEMVTQLSFHVRGGQRNCVSVFISPIDG